MPKTPTQRSITHVLLKAGLTKSQKRQGSPPQHGFVVRDDGAGTVRVHHHVATRVRSHADLTASSVTRWETRYTLVIEEAGYAARRGDGGYSSPIIVTSQDADKAAGPQDRQSR